MKRVFFFPLTRAYIFKHTCHYTLALQNTLTVFPLSPVRHRIGLLAKEVRGTEQIFSFSHFILAITFILLLESDPE